jgi:outer membrane protein assembly factor BamA
VDVALGLLAPFGRSARQPAALATRVPDRFFLFGSKCRGFDALGPRAAPVDGGPAVFGDALGGDALAALSLRLLLPPPVPSVRFSNFGARTQLWATAASLSLSSAAAPAPATQQPALGPLGRVSAAAGVGLLLPISAGASLEFNYPLWSHAGSGTGDKGSSGLRFCISG